MTRLIIALVAASCANPAFSYAADPAREAVAKHFIGPSENIAKDAAWTSRRMFKVGVIDNGTSRDGYAQYVCQIVREHGIADPDLRVQVIDIAKLVRTDKWVKLGEAACR